MNVDLDKMINDYITGSSGKPWFVYHLHGLDIESDMFIEVCFAIPYYPSEIDPEFGVEVSSKHEVHSIIKKVVDNPVVEEVEINIYYAGALRKSTFYDDSVQLLGLADELCEELSMFDKVVECKVL